MKKCHLEFAKSGIKKNVLYPHRLHGYSTDRIRTKNCSKLDQKLSKIGFVTPKIVINCSKLTKIKGMQHAALVTKTKMNTPIKRIVFITKIVVYCNKLTKIILL